eukprot:jgi/Ulvmu1/12209/UM085_0073.1
MPGWISTAAKLCRGEKHTVAWLSCLNLEPSVVFSRHYRILPCGVLQISDRNQAEALYNRTAMCRVDEEEWVASLGYFEALVHNEFSDPRPILPASADDTPQETVADGIPVAPFIPREVGFRAHCLTLQAEQTCGRSLHGAAGSGTWQLQRSANSFQERELTVPVAPQMQMRAQLRPKPTQQVKLEQDIELARREGEAAYARRFAKVRCPP